MLSNLVLEAFNDNSFSEHHLEMLNIKLLILKEEKNINEEKSSIRFGSL